MTQQDSQIMPCPSCGKSIKFEMHHIGKKVRCPKCKHQFEIRIAQPPPFVVPKATTVRRQRKKTKISTLVLWCLVALFASSPFNFLVLYVVMNRAVIKEEQGSLVFLQDGTVRTKDVARAIVLEGTTCIFVFGFLFLAAALGAVYLAMRATERDHQSS